MSEEGTDVCRWGAVRAAAGVAVVGVLSAGAVGAALRPRAPEAAAVAVAPATAPR